MNTQASLEPKYFPKIGDRFPAVKMEAIADMAFVLSGVAPKFRSDRKLAAKGKTLRDLTNQPWARVSSTSELTQDHRYLVAPIYGIDAERFRQAWEDEHEASHQGQARVEITKLFKQLEMHSRNIDATTLATDSNREFVRQLSLNCVPLIKRLLRATRRKIESIHRDRTAEVPNSWWAQLWRRFIRQSLPDAIQVDGNTLRATEHYLSQCLKLGLILRKSRPGAASLTEGPNPREAAG